MKKYLLKIKQIILIAGVAGFLLVIFPASVSAKEITVENIVELVNQSRAAEKLQPLVLNEKLAQAALAKAQDMMAQDYFAHTSPQGKTPWFWIEKAQYDYKYAGENLAMGFFQAEKEHAAWMNSPTHRQNILNSHYQEIGVAVAQGVIDKKKVTIAVQEFGSRLDFVSEVTKKENASKQKEQKIAPVGNVGKVLGNKIENLDLYNIVNFGVSGVLGLVLAGSLALAGFIAMDHLVLGYMRRKKEKAQLALYTLSEKDYLQFLNDKIVDISKLQIIYLQPLKPKK